MNPTDKPIVNPLVVLREEFDDWAVLFNPDTADAVGINPIGVVVWKKMDGTRTLTELVAEVRAAFSEVSETVSDEVSSFVDDLTQNGFAGYEASPAP
jgi:SynChlorMet cassette protein ScmD